MNEKKYKEKLLELIMELGKPKKFEVGYADANRIVQDGLAIIGLDSSDILGFAKPANERAIRRLRGTQAWFKNMYKNGWRYVDTFEYEGLPYNGFVVMERELRNLTLDVIREEIEVLLKDDEGEKYIHVPNPEILRGGPKLINSDLESVVPKGLARKKITLTEKGLKAKEEFDKALLKAGKVKKEGFESDVNDFMLDAQKELKTLEELFFDDTGKNAVWRGKETKAFKEWKEKISD